MAAHGQGSMSEATGRCRDPGCSCRGRGCVQRLNPPRLHEVQVARTPRPVMGSNRAFPRRLLPPRASPPWALPFGQVLLHRQRLWRRSSVLAPLVPTVPAPRAGPLPRRWSLPPPPLPILRQSLRDSRRARPWWAAGRAWPAGPHPCRPAWRTSGTGRGGPRRPPRGGRGGRRRS